MKDKNDVQFMHCLLAGFRAHDTACSTRLNLFIEVKQKNSLLENISEKNSILVKFSQVGVMLLHLFISGMPQGVLVRMSYFG